MKATNHKQNVKALEAALATARATVVALEAALTVDDSASLGEDDLLKLRECGPSVRTLRAAIGAGELEAVLVGREYRVRRGALSAWLEAHRVKPRERAPRELSAAERAIERARRAGTLKAVG
ncbi:MAG: helix-turn-helix domain-containing protein [Polyangiaceae bacterium]